MKRKSILILFLAVLIAVLSLGITYCEPLSDQYGEKVTFTETGEEVVPIPIAGAAEVHTYGDRIRVKYNTEIQDRTMDKSAFSLKVGGAIRKITSIYRLPAEPSTIEIVLEKTIFSTETDILLSYSFSTNCVTSMQGVYGAAYNNLPVRNGANITPGTPEIDFDNLIITGISTSGANLVEECISGNIKVFGNNFSTSISGNAVRIVSTSSGTSYSVTVQSATKTEIIAKLPKTLYADRYRVSVTVGGKTVTSTATFRVEVSEDYDEFEGKTFLSKTTAGKRAELRVSELKDMLKSALQSGSYAGIGGKIDDIISALNSANTDSAIYEVALQFNRACEYLRSYIKDRNVKSSVKQALIDDIIELANCALGLVSRIRTEENAVQFLTRLSDGIGYLSEIAERVQEYDRFQKFVGMLQNMVVKTVPVFEVITDELKGYDTLQRMLNSIRKVIAAAPLEDVSEAFKDKIQDAVGAIIDEYSTVTIKTGRDGRAIIKSDQKEDIARKAKAIDRKIGSIAEALFKITGKSTLREKLIVRVDSPTSANDIILEYPSGNLFAFIDGTGVDSWELNTNNGDLYIRRGNVGLESDTRAVNIRMRQVNNAHEVDNRYQDYFRNDKIFDISMSYTRKDGTVSRIQTFNKEIMIRIPFSLKTSQNPEKVAVLYLSPDGIPENMLAVYDSKLKKTAFWTEHLSQYVVRYNDVYFTDVTPSNWAKKYIDAMATRGIALGVGQGMFNPFAPVTRAEFASYIIRSFKAFDSKYECSFTDVDKGAWYYKTVASAAVNGIVRGIPGNKFDPNGRITRQDMAVMLSRAIGKFMRLGAPTDERDARWLYDYETVNDYARSNVNSVVGYGVMVGKPGNCFAPYDLVTRAEAVTVVYRLLELKDR